MTGGARGLLIVPTGGRALDVPLGAADRVTERCVVTHPFQAVMAL